MPKNFSQKGFTANLLNFMKDLEQNKLCCLDFLTQVYTQNSPTVTFTGLGTKASPLIATAVGGGGSVTATNGLQLIGGAVGLGGTLTQITNIASNGFDINITGTDDSPTNAEVININPSRDVFMSYTGGEAGSARAFVINHNVEGGGAAPEITLTSTGGSSFWQMDSATNIYNPGGMLMASSGINGMTFVVTGGGPIAFANAIGVPTQQHQFAKFTSGGNFMIGAGIASVADSGYLGQFYGNVQVTGNLDVKNLTNGGDGAGPGAITANGVPFIHLGSALNTADTFSTFIGIKAGAAARTTNSTIQSATAVGYGALQSVSVTNNIFATALGTGALQNLTAGTAMSAMGWACGNGVTNVTDYAAYGTGAGAEANGTASTFIGSGAGAGPSFTSFNHGITTAVNTTLIGAYAGAGVTGGTFQGVTILGANSTKATNSGTLTNTTIVGQGMTTDLNNVAVIARDDQNVIVGETAAATDNGYKLQVNGAVTLGTTALPTTPVNGALETDGVNLYFTVGGVRKTVTLS